MCPCRQESRCGCSKTFGRYWKEDDVDYRSLTKSVEYFNVITNKWETYGKENSRSMS